MKQEEQEFLKPVFEMVRFEEIQMEVAGKFKNWKILNPSSAKVLAEHFISDFDREALLVVCLSEDDEVIAVNIASVGTINSALIHPREIYKIAFINNASSILLAHNHPSGSAKESREDVEVTKRLIDVGNILGIPLYDHIIVTPTGESTSIKKVIY